MQRTIAAIIALSALVAACGEQPDDTYDTTVPEFAGSPVSPAAYVMAPGRYSIEGADGTAYSQTLLRTDGRYIDFDTDGVEVGGGTWRDYRGKACFDPEGDGEDEQERCWINSALAEDGSFTTPRDDGTDSYTVRPLDSDD